MTLAPEQVLMEALCGTGFTILLAAISPAKRHFDETANTLNFAAKCGSIPRQVANNEPEHLRELRELQETVKLLRSEIRLLKEAKATEAAADPIEQFNCPGSVEVFETVRREEFEALQAELQREKIRNVTRLHYDATSLEVVFYQILSCPIQITIKTTCVNWTQTSTSSLRLHCRMKSRP